MLTSITFGTEGDRARYELRFWRKVDKAGRNAPHLCWYWTGFRNRDGYGQGQWKGRNVMAHRLSWMLTNGEIQDGKVICHKCNHPACCRPSHLYVGSHLDNVMDRTKHGAVIRETRKLLAERRRFAYDWTPARKKALLLLAEGTSANQVAKILDVHPNTISNWKKTPEFWHALIRVVPGAA